MTPHAPTNPPSAEELARFLKSLMDDGRLTATDIEFLKAHARLDERTGENWQIAAAAAEGVKQKLSEELNPEQKAAVPHWSDPPTWHVVDCLQRWLGHAIAQEYDFYRSRIPVRQKDGTRRWWMAIGEIRQESAGKCIGARIREELVQALDQL